MPKPKASIGCKVSKDGRVTVMLIRNGKPDAGVGMPAKDVGGLVVMLLASAMEAAKMSGESPRVSGASLVGMPCIQPTALGLSAGELPEPHSHLVVHAGMAQFGIALPKPRELAHALWLVGKLEGPLQ